MPPPVENCKSCRWYQPINAEKGTCTALPPIQIRVRHDPYLENPENWVRPIVSPRCVCSLWKKA